MKPGEWFQPDFLPGLKYSGIRIWRSKLKFEEWFHEQSPGPLSAFPYQQCSNSSLPRSLRNLLEIINSYADILQGFPNLVLGGC
ncbi:hypothetical protein ACFX2I_032415 [Malus domestica]